MVELRSDEVAGCGCGCIGEYDVGAALLLTPGLRDLLSWTTGGSVRYWGSTAGRAGIIEDGTTETSGVEATGRRRGAV